MMHVLIYGVACSIYCTPIGISQPSALSQAHVVASRMKRRVSSGVYTTLAVVLVVLQAARASPLSQDPPWPYLQVYPPVNGSDGRTPLYFALMLSFGGDYTSVGALPGVQIALDYINSQPDILPGYSLHYTLTDSQVRVHKAEHLFNALLVLVHVAMGNRSYV